MTFTCYGNHQMSPMLLLSYESIAVIPVGPRFLTTRALQEDQEH